MTRKQNRNTKTDFKKIAETFRSKTFLDKNEAVHFNDYAVKEGLKNVQMWEIPDNPMKWKVAWTER